MKRHRMTHGKGHKYGVTRYVVWHFDSTLAKFTYQRYGGRAVGLLTYFRVYRYRCPRCVYTDLGSFIICFLLKYVHRKNYSNIPQSRNIFYLSK